MMTEQRQLSGSRDQESLNNVNTLAFRPWHHFSSGGASRTVALLWLFLCLLTIPSGMFTRLFEWSGMAFEMGGNTIHLTLYLPLIICIPLVLTYGLMWAVIPAYLSTVCVAVLGGMPWPWIVLFSFANPLGLAVFYKFYRATRLRTDMRSISSIIGFAGISLLASLTGSIGAFIWTHTSSLELHSVYPIWQGWWLGGWFQAMLIDIPILWLISPAMDRLMAPLRAKEKSPESILTGALPVMLATMVILTLYVAAARYFSLEQLDAVVANVADPQVKTDMMNTIDGLSYPLYILVLAMLSVSFFGYRAIIYWNGKLRQLNSDLNTRNVLLEKLATTDALSGVFNRRKVMELIEQEFVRTRRVHINMSILMVDADNFKKINDNHGHLAGDDVIRELGKRLSLTLREYDVLGRYGGEEFIVLLPETNMADAHYAAERIRMSVEKSTVTTSAGELGVTVSVGYASIHRSDEYHTDIIERSDRALYKAKQAGRNCVEADRSMVDGDVASRAAERLKAGAGR